jgi:hypothetical protein
LYYESSNVMSIWTCALLCLNLKSNTPPHTHTHTHTECTQTFPDWLDKEIIIIIIIIIINTRWEATQRVMAAKLTRLTCKIAIHLLLVAESCTLCSFRSRPVRKLLDAHSCVRVCVKCSDISVVWRWATGWTIGVLGFDSQRGLEIFVLATASRPALGSAQLPIQRVPGALSRG